jgi:large subunit ribosomal protein L10
MALTRAKKTDKVAALAADLASSTSAIIGTFTGLNASKDSSLRKTVREAGGSYHVVKNKLAARSSQGTKVEAALQGLKGVSAVAYTSGDPVALAKALSTWVKDNAEFTFKLGIVDGRVITVDEIKALSTLPSKEDLFSKLLFLIQSPAQRLATVINATGRDLAIVLNQAAEQEKFTGKAPAAAAGASSQAEASPEAEASPVSEVAAAHAEEAPTPAEQIAADPASEADPQADPAQPENGTASQAGEAASTEPAEG